jgi:peptidoglycan hydrolase CwlO-like protein
LAAEEADLADSTRRTDASLHELHTQIAHYESQKARLRALIDAAGENDHIPNEQQYQQHLLNASAEAGELHAKIYDIDRKLALKSDEIEKLQAEVARMDEERPSDVVEVDDEMSELDDRISDRQTVLKQLLDDAQRLGIKLKPGVWV